MPGSDATIARARSRSAASCLRPPGVYPRIPSKSIITLSCRARARARWPSRVWFTGKTIVNRLGLVRRFAEFTGTYPWDWTPEDVEAYFSTRLSRGELAWSTVRGQQGSLEMFCAFITDGRYGWAAGCLEEFGRFPVQVCHDWNTAQHVAVYEGRPGRRAFTYDELQTLFDAADDRVEQIRKRGRKGVLAAWRDSVRWSAGRPLRHARSRHSSTPSPRLVSPAFANPPVCGAAVSDRYGEPCPGAGAASAARASWPRRRTSAPALSARRLAHARATARADHAAEPSSRPTGPARSAGTARSWTRARTAYHDRWCRAHCAGLAHRYALSGHSVRSAVKFGHPELELLLTLQEALLTTLCSLFPLLLPQQCLASFLCLPSMQQ